MKHTLLACLLLFASINPALANTRPVPAGVYLVDVLIYRPFGLITTIVGSALYVGISPMTALANISPPHDAFEKLAGLMIAAPAKFTFYRPMGVYYPDPDGRYRRHPEAAGQVR